MKTTKMVWAVVLAAAVVTGSAWAGAMSSGMSQFQGRAFPILLSFDSMYGVEGPFLGATNAIRGVEGDEAPWVISSARGRLDKFGHLTLQVHGLVFANDPLVEPGLIGKNDEANFRALVSCQTVDASGAIGTANVTSAPFPATARGDAHTSQTITLPNPCIDPVVFILAGSEDKWFAVDGFENESAPKTTGGSPVTLQTR